jgi:hypothetical protein
MEGGAAPLRNVRRSENKEPVAAGRAGIYGVPSERVAGSCSIECGGL